MQKRDLAHADWEGGMKYRDIAAKHGVSESTVKSWAARYWKSEEDAPRVATKGKKVATKKLQPAQPKTVDQQLAEAVEENSELTPQQRDFCWFYSRTRNATQAYLRAYDCAYSTARSEGSDALAKPNIQAELCRLRDIKAAAVGELFGDDIVEMHMRIAFADMTDFADIVNGYVRVKDGDHLDGQLIKELSEGPDGPKIKLESRHKSLEFLERYFGLDMASRDTMGDRESNLQSLIDILRTPAENRELPDEDAVAIHEESEGVSAKEL